MRLLHTGCWRQKGDPRNTRPTQQSSSGWKPSGLSGSTPGFPAPTEWPKDLPCRPPRWKGRQLVPLEPVCGRETTCEDPGRHQDRFQRTRIGRTSLQQSTRKPPSAGQRRRIGTSLQHRPGGRHQRVGGGQSGHISLEGSSEAAVSGLGGRRHGKPRRHRELHSPLKQVDIAGVELCLNNPFFWGTFNFIFISHNVRDLYFLFYRIMCYEKREKYDNVFSNFCDYFCCHFSDMWLLLLCALYLLMVC